MHRTIFSKQANNIILQQNDMQTKQHICRVDLTFILQDQFSQEKQPCTFNIYFSQTVY